MLEFIHLSVSEIKIQLLSLFMIPHCKQASAGRRRPCPPTRPRARVRPSRPLEPFLGGSVISPVNVKLRKDEHTQSVQIGSRLVHMICNISHLVEIWAPKVMAISK